MVSNFAYGKLKNGWRRNGMDKKLSIIIPTYNSEKYIDRCLESIFNQPYKNIEVILVDDGSSDGTYEKCQKIASNDNRVQSYQIEHAGASATRNFGISKMSGDFLMFVDSDDELYPHSLHEIMTIMDDDSIDMVVFKILKIWEDKKTYIFDTFKNKKIDYKEYAQFISYTDDGPCGGGYTVNKVMRVSSLLNYFKTIPLFNSRFYVYEDKLWFLNVARAFSCIYIADIVGYIYYIRSGSLSSNIDDNRMLNHYDAIGAILESTKAFNFCNKTIIEYCDNIRTHLLFALYYREKYKGKGLKSRLKPLKFSNLSKKNKIKYLYLLMISFKYN